MKLNEYTLNSLKVGLEEEFEVTIEKFMVKLFLQLTGDTNPLHCEPAYAKENNFPDIVVYGMLTSSFYSKLVGVYLPGKYCLLQECQINYRKPVYIGDHLTVKGVIREIQKEIRRVTVKAQIINQNNEKVSDAKIVVKYRKC